MTSEQDQVFGANPKIGKKNCSSVALYHDTSDLKTSRGSAYGFKLLIPKAEYFSEVSLANYTQAAFREKTGYLAIDHKLESKKERYKKTLQRPRRKHIYYKTAHINFKSPQVTWVKEFYV